jgi:hypothetical protein
MPVIGGAPHLIDDPGWRGRYFLRTALKFLHDIQRIIAYKEH